MKLPRIFSYHSNTHSTVQSLVTWPHLSAMEDVKYSWFTLYSAKRSFTPIDKGQIAVLDTAKNMYKITVTSLFETKAM